MSTYKNTTLDGFWNDAELYLGAEESVKSINYMISDIYGKMNARKRSQEKDLLFYLHLDIDGDFVCPNEQVFEDICKVIDEFPCKFLSLVNFHKDQILDPWTKAILLKAGVSSARISNPNDDVGFHMLDLDGTFSDNVMDVLCECLRMHSTKNSLRRFVARNFNISLEASKKLASLSSSLGNGIYPEAELLLASSQLDDKTLSNLMEASILSGFSKVMISDTNLHNKPQSCQALGQFLSSKDCQISKLSLVGTTNTPTTCSSSEPKHNGILDNNQSTGLDVLVQAMTVRNSSIIYLELSGLYLTESKLKFLFQNLSQLFSQLEHLCIDISQVDSLSFLQPLILSANDYKTNNNNKGAAPVKSILFQNAKCSVYQQNKTISAKDDELLLGLLKAYPTLAMIKGVSMSPMIRHQIQMNSKWRQFVSINNNNNYETALSIEASSSLLPQVFVMVAKEEEKTACSIRYDMLQQLIGYGHFLTTTTSSVTTIQYNNDNHNTNESNNTEKPLERSVMVRKEAEEPASPNLIAKEESKRHTRRCSLYSGLQENTILCPLRRCSMV